MDDRGIHIATLKLRDHLASPGPELQGIHALHQVKAGLDVGFIAASGMGERTEIRQPAAGSDVGNRQPAFQLGIGQIAVGLRRFDAAIAQLGASGVSADVVHAANSAGLLAHPDARRDMVRAGISIYGVPPSPALEGIVELEPALDLVSRVIAVRTVAPGESVSYGRHWWADEPTRVATVAIGYADGIRRDSGSAGVEVLIRGHRCPIVGTVTMDQLMVALAPAIADEASAGDEAVLIGRQGADEITAIEIATRLGTIAYEVLTSISSRVPRVPV